MVSDCDVVWDIARVSAILSVNLELEGLPGISLCLDPCDLNQQSVVGDDINVVLDYGLLVRSLLGIEAIGSDEPVTPLLEDSPVLRGVGRAGRESDSVLSNEELGQLPLAFTHALLLDVKGIIGAVSDSFLSLRIVPKLVPCSRVLYRGSAAVLFLLENLVDLVDDLGHWSHGSHWGNWGNWGDWEGAYRYDWY